MPVNLWKNLNCQVAYMNYSNKILKGNPVMPNNEESALMAVVIGYETIKVHTGKTRFSDMECLIFKFLNNDKFHII